MTVQPTKTGALLTLFQAMVLLAVGPSANAQERGPVSADRPSNSASPIALADGLWQFEFGYKYTRVGAGVDDHALPNLLVRHGIADHLELRISWDGYSWIDSGGNAIDGANDASVGFKWQLSDDGATTSFALFGALSMPVGSSSISSDDWEPTFGLFWSHAGRLDFFGTATITDSSGDPVVGNAIGISLPGAGRFGGYVEYYGEFQSGAGPRHSINVGLSYLQNNDLLLDAFVEAGLNDHAADYVIGFGASKRF